MTTRQTSAPPMVPTVTQIGSTVGCLQNDGLGHLIFRSDSPRHAEHMAAVLRGLLADAYSAGRADSSPIPLSTRERFLISEALTRLDPDTLNDDIPDPADHVSGAELDALADRIRP